MEKTLLEMPGNQNFGSPNLIMSDLASSTTLPSLTHSDTTRPVEKSGRKASGWDRFEAEGLSSFPGDAK